MDKRSRNKRNILIYKTINSFGLMGLIALAVLHGSMGFAIALFILLILFML